MAESWSSDESARENLLVEAEIEAVRAGRAWAGGLALVCLAAAIAFFALGNNVAGGAFLGLPALGLIRSFIIRPRSSKEGGSGNGASTAVEDE